MHHHQRVFSSKTVFFGTLAFTKIILTIFFQIIKFEIFLLLSVNDKNSNFWRKKNYIMPTRQNWPLNHLVCQGVFEWISNCACVVPTRFACRGNINQPPCSFFFLFTFSFSSVSPPLFLPLLPHFSPPLWLQISWTRKCSSATEWMNFWSWLIVFQVS